MRHNMRRCANIGNGCKLSTAHNLNSNIHDLVDDDDDDDRYTNNPLSVYTLTVRYCTPKHILNHTTISVNSTPTRHPSPFSLSQSPIRMRVPTMRRIHHRQTGCTLLRFEYVEWGCKAYCGIVYWNYAGAATEHKYKHEPGWKQSQRRRVVLWDVDTKGIIHTCLKISQNQPQDLAIAAFINVKAPWANVVCRKAAAANDKNLCKCKSICWMFIHL